MNWRQSKIRLIITGGLLSALVVNAGCTPVPDFDSRLSSIVKPYTFSIVGWELRTIPHEVNEWIFNKRGGINNEVDIVTRYFSIVEQIRTLQSQIETVNPGNKERDSASLKADLVKLQQQRAELVAKVERILGKQINDSLVQQGIFNPITKLKVGFPPLNFALEKPPHLLVVSPKDRIESMKEIALKQSISLEEIEGIETEVDQLDVSSLVVELGGFGGTFPTFVADNGSFRFIINTIIEEWLHQYLAFTPLGFSYLLDLSGVSQNYEVATMNETVASIVSKEIGAMVYSRYYSDDQDGVNQRRGEEFNQEMREIRRAVDKYLDRGEIEQAERFMEERRQYLASKGYYIRRLNQAYFAFYGTYADAPTSISPIGLELRKLREQSASVKDFLDTVASMTSRVDLRISIE